MQASPTIHSRLVAATIIALTLWLGGFGCSFCCATGVMDACCEDAPGLSGSSSSSQESCCKPPVDASETTSAETVLSPAGIKDCSLLPSQLASLSVEHRISGEMAFIADIAAPAIEIDNDTRTEALIYPPTPRNRGATYLRCCALLI